MGSVGRIAILVALCLALLGGESRAQGQYVCASQGHGTKSCTAAPAGSSEYFFANRVTLLLGIEQYVGVSTVQGGLAGVVDARLVGAAASITHLDVGTSGLLVLGQSVQYRLYMSTDDGASYSSVASATQAAGTRKQTTTFAAIAVPSGARLVIGVTVLGLAFTGAVSAVAY